MHRRVGSGDGRSRYWFPLTAIPPPSRPPLLGGGKLPPPAGAGWSGGDTGTENRTVESGLSPSWEREPPARSTTQPA